MTSFACYDLKNVKTTGYDVIVNRPKVAAYRAPSAPMAAFAVESTMDELAKKIGMDALELRIKNAAKEGTKSSYGPTYGPIGIGPTLEAAKNHPQMKAPLGKNQGRGVACGFWFNFGGQTCTTININADGTAVLSVGTIDVGGSRASMCLMAAEELGIAYEKVRCVVADTSSLGFNDMSDGSRVTFSSGMATVIAARNAKKVLCKRAAKMWNIPEDAVEWVDGHARPAGQNAGNFPPMSLKEIAAAAANTGGPIAGHNEFVADGAGVSFATHICDVEVDPETGATKDHPLCGDPGRRQGDPSILCGRPIPGRCGAGHRLGAQRRIYLWEGRTAAESGIPRLQDAGVLGSSVHRHRHPRNSQPQPSLRRARGWRDVDRAAAGGDRQRGVQRGRGADEAHSDVAAADSQGDRGFKTSRLMVQVHFWGALKPLAGGLSSVDVEAGNIRELFQRLEEAHPGMKPHIERGIAVSINGKIFRDSWDEALPANAEIYLLPRIAGG